ncbi:MAG: hypothetical protein H0V03_10385 [Thermoleophilaceae bacterium]|nr:hypothetical protein [Thermoleophilaceae bacterium]
MALEVRPVRSRRELRRFVALPRRLHRDEPCWIPPLASERRRFLDRGRNPFFEHAEAEYLLAWRAGRVVGRISAHVDFRLNQLRGSAWGLFGFFECEPDAQAARALLAAAEDWLRRRACERMVGPMDFTLNHEAGLLVEGHDRPPQILEPWHPPHYAGLLEGHGLSKAMDLLKWELDVSDRSRIQPAIIELAERLEPEHGIRIRHFRRRDLAAETRRFLDVYNTAWERSWGFVPLTEAEIEDYAHRLRRLLDPNWVMVAENSDGDTVGAALTLPDYNQVLRRVGGRLLPLGWARALVARRRIDAVRVFALGVRPEYQHCGVAAALYVKHFEMAARTRQRGGEMGWVLETNTAMNRAMEGLGGRLVKRHRVYEKRL